MVKALCFKIVPLFFDWWYISTKIVYFCFLIRSQYHSTVNKIILNQIKLQFSSAIYRYDWQVTQLLSLALSSLYPIALIFLINKMLTYYSILLRPIQLYSYFSKPPQFTLNTQFRLNFDRYFYFIKKLWVIP